MVIVEDVGDREEAMLQGLGIVVVAKITRSRRYHAAGGVYCVLDGMLEGLEGVEVIQLLKFQHTRI